MDVGDGERVLRDERARGGGVREVREVRGERAGDGGREARELGARVVAAARSISSAARSTPRSFASTSSVSQPAAAAPRLRFSAAPSPQKPCTNGLARNCSNGRSNHHAVCRDALGTTARASTNSGSSAHALIASTPASLTHSLSVPLQ